MSGEHDDVVVEQPASFEFTADWLASRLKGKATSIKAALIDQQNNQRDFRMILRNRVGDGLQEHSFARTRGGNDQTTLPFAERRNQVDDASRQIVRRGFHPQLLVRIEWGQIVKEDFLTRLVRGFKVDCLDLDQGEVALALLRRANLTADSVTGLQVELADL